MCQLNRFRRDTVPSAIENMKSIKSSENGESGRESLISSNNFPIEFRHENTNKRVIYLEKENGKIKREFPFSLALECLLFCARNK